MLFYFGVYAAIAVWMYLDGKKRLFNAIPWCAATVLLGPVVVPLYLAYRPLREGEVREGGRAWNVLRNFALFWTLTMAIAGIAGMVGASEVASTATGDAEKAGAAIGMGLGMGLICAGWFFPMAAAMVVGFFLKKASVIEKGPTGQLANHPSSSGEPGTEPAQPTAEKAGGLQEVVNVIKGKATEVVEKVKQGGSGSSSPPPIPASEPGSLSPREKASKRVQEDLAKLDAAKEAGLLTDEEYEAKRQSHEAKIDDYEVEAVVEEKTAELTEALTAGILEQSEYDATISALEAQARESIEEERRQKAEAENQRANAEKIASLRAALEQGILTQEEYDAKVESLD